MALDFNKIEEPDDSVFPVKLEDDSNLDMYGVWVKKRPENTAMPPKSIDIIVNTFKKDQSIFPNLMP